MSESTFSTTEDIIKCADSWNLAKDVGLLHYLEKFSEELIGNATKTKEKLNSLLTELNDTNVKFNVIQNKFQSLHNTQFIESRVYEDDETLESQECVKKDDSSSSSSQNLTESDKLKTMKNVILRGVEVVDKYFDKVEVPGSDSEDEVDFPRFTLRAKDPYSDRPLPYVIGTEEWHKKWHVGLLEETSSESEDEKISNKESCSDSEDTLPMYRPQVLGTSETSSEIEYNKSEISLPPSATHNTEIDKNSFYSQTPVANSTFADQLAAKLGDVFDQNRNIEEPVVNTRAIQKVPESYKCKNVFPDEPPPLLDNDDDDDDDDEIFNSGMVKTNNLFDDLDDNNSFWSNDPIKTKVKPSDKINKNNNVEKEQNKMVDENKNKNNNKKIVDLFDDEDEDSDDIFNTNPVIKNEKPFLIEQKKITVPLFRGEPPDISAKKPFGAGSSSIINKTDNSNNNEKQNDNLISKEKDTGYSKENKMADKNLKQTVDIFSDNVNDLFDDDLFTNVETNKFASNLFSDVSVSDDTKNPSSSPLSKTPSKDTFSDIDTNKKSTTSTKGLSLFDDVNDDFDDLFSQGESQSKLFDDKSSNNKIWPDEINEQEIDKEEEMENKNDSQLEKLLDDDNNIRSDIIEKGDWDNKEIIEDVKITKNNLFSNTPPELDDDWDVTVTSDNNLFEDMFDKIPEIHPYKLGLFMSDEPPTLDDKQEEVVKSVIIENSEKKIVENVSSLTDTSPKKLPGKLKHSLNINVSALLPPGVQKQKSKVLTNLEANINTNTTPSDISKSFESDEKEQKQDEKPHHQEHTPQRSSISFDEQIDGIETLDSVTKNRVRAPIQRRPSTRKGRQRNLRSTDSNYTINLLEKGDNGDKTCSETFGDDDNNEYEYEKIESKKEEQEISVNKKRSTERLFDSSGSESDSELFSSSSKLKITSEKQKKVGDVINSNVSEAEGGTRFDTDNDDIFKVSSTSIKKIEPHKDLFGDDTDDDDLFFTSKPKRNDKGSTGTKPKVIKGTSKSSIKKLDNEAKPVLDDPLTLLG